MTFQEIHSHSWLIILWACKYMYLPSSSLLASGWGTKIGSEGELSATPQRFVAPLVTSTFNICTISYRTQNFIELITHNTHICRRPARFHSGTIHKVVPPSIKLLVVYLRKLKCCYNVTKLISNSECVANFVHKCLLRPLRIKCLFELRPLQLILCFLG